MGALSTQPSEALALTLTDLLFFAERAKTWRQWQNGPTT